MIRLFIIVCLLLTGGTAYAEDDDTIKSESRVISDGNYGHHN